MPIPEDVWRPKILAHGPHIPSGLSCGLRSQPWGSPVACRRHTQEAEDIQLQAGEERMDRLDRAVFREDLVALDGRKQA